MNIRSIVKKIIPASVLERVSPDMNGVYDNYANDRHRTEKYPLPGTMRQFWVVYRMQMKLFTKGLVPAVLLLMILAIPLIMFSGVLDSFVIDSTRAEIGNTGETYVAICLSLMPVMMALTASMVCGSILSQEFRVRTAFLNFPMPQSRVSFYLGKFLAGFTLVLCTVLLAFMVSIILAASAGYPSVSSYAVGQALLLSVAGCFAFSGITYGMSAFMSRGSAMLPFVFLFAILPAVTLILTDSVGAGGIAGLVPGFAGQMAVNALGYADPPSVTMLFSSIQTDLSASVFLSSASYVICGLAVLVIGLLKTKGREI